MAEKRLLYLALTIGAGICYLVSGGWLSWIFLLTVLALPWASLAVSLPAIRRFSLSTTGPDVLQMGESAEFWLLGSCDGPMPPFRGDIRLTHRFSSVSRKYPGEKGITPAHCGSLSVTVEKGRVCDYLGLFAFRVRHPGSRVLPVRPKPLEIPNPELPDSEISHGWRPKFGAAPAENHEIRLYRPGDSRNLVHWKLSAKTGQLLLREPMEPLHAQSLLTLTLKGSPVELDRKLGRLLWLGRKLLEQGREFEVRALTADGIAHFRVDSEATLLRGLDSLLCAKPTASGSIREHHFEAGWQYHIGGQPDEA